MYKRRTGVLLCSALLASTAWGWSANKTTKVVSHHQAQATSSSQNSSDPIDVGVTYPAFD